MTEQRPSKDQLPDVKLTEEQDARANILATKMDLEYFGRRASARLIVHLQDELEAANAELFRRREQAVFYAELAYGKPAAAIVGVQRQFTPEEAKAYRAFIEEFFDTGASQPPGADE